MQSPYIGRGIALVVIAGLVAWTAFRALGSRPPETPKIPFPAPAADAPLATSKSQQTAVLAGGCFWGLQAVFEHLKGVSSVTSGYAGGYVKSRSYAMESPGSGHRLPIPLRDLLHHCGTGAHRSGLHRTARCCKGLLPPHRHESRALPSLLSRRELPSGFPQEQSRQSLYYLQRPAQAGKSEEE